MVGFHGQTVLHRRGERADRADRRRDGAAKRLGIAGGARLPRGRCRAGGQGAPLVPVFHRAIVDTRPAASGWRCSTSAASPMSPSWTAARSDRLRHRAGQCADRRFHARAHRRATMTIGDAAASRMTGAIIACMLVATRFFEQASRRSRSTATRLRSPISACRTFRSRMARRPVGADRRSRGAFDASPLTARAGRRWRRNRQRQRVDADAGGYGTTDGDRRARGSSAGCRAGARLPMAGGGVRCAATIAPRPQRALVRCRRRSPGCRSA